MSTTAPSPSREDTPGSSSEPYRAALVAVCQAAECYGALGPHFESREVRIALAACRTLAKRNQRAIGWLRDAGHDPGEATPWLDAAAREFLLRVTGPRELLEVALAMAEEASRACERLRAAVPEDEAGELARRLCTLSRADVLRLRDAIDRLAPAPDWEALIAEGAVPALALGAERRSMRNASGLPDCGQYAARASVQASRIAASEVAHGRAQDARATSGLAGRGRRGRRHDRVCCGLGYALRAFHGEPSQIRD